MMTFTEFIEHETKGMTPWEKGRKREQLLASGLRALGANFGLLFREPLQIDANGEFSLVVDHDVRGYGQPFVDLLNKHNPRTGIAPTKYVDPRNNWCRVNHFDVERMLNEALPQPLPKEASSGTQAQPPTDS